MQLELIALRGLEQQLEKLHQIPAAPLAHGHAFASGEADIVAGFRLHADQQLRFRLLEVEHPVVRRLRVFQRARQGHFALGFDPRKNQAAVRLQFLQIDERRVGAAERAARAVEKIFAKREYGFHAETEKALAREAVDFLVEGLLKFSPRPRLQNRAAELDYLLVPG